MPGWLSANRNWHRVIAWVAGVLMTGLAGPFSAIFRVLGGQPLEFSVPLTLASLYLACIGMTVPTALLLFAISKRIVHFAPAVAFIITAFICLGAVATLQTEFMSQASTGGATPPDEALTFGDTAAHVAIAITVVIFVSSLVAQMELAREEYEY